MEVLSHSMPVQLVVAFCATCDCHRCNEGLLQLWLLVAVSSSLLSGASKSEVSKHVHAVKQAVALVPEVARKSRKLVAAEHVP